MKVGICIGTYKRPNGLRRLLSKINELEFLNEFKNLEVIIIVVDNDAQKSSLKVVNSLKDQLKWPLIYDIEPKRGIPCVRNKAVKIAIKNHVDYIVFIDDDEVPEKYWLN